MLGRQPLEAEARICCRAASETVYREHLVAKPTRPTACSSSGRRSILRNTSRSPTALWRESSSWGTSTSSATA